MLHDNSPTVGNLVKLPMAEMEEPGVSTRLGYSINSAEGIDSIDKIPGSVFVLIIKFFCNYKKVRKVRKVLKMRKVQKKRVQCQRENQATFMLLLNLYF